MELKIESDKIFVEEDFMEEIIEIEDEEIKNIEIFFKSLIVYKELGEFTEEIYISPELEEKLEELPKEIKELFDDLIGIVNSSEIAEGEE